VKFVIHGSVILLFKFYNREQNSLH